MGDLTSVFVRHVFFEIKISSESGTPRVFKPIHEVTKLHEITLETASLKQPQTVGFLNYLGAHSTVFTSSVPIIIERLAQTAASSQFCP